MKFKDTWATDEDGNQFVFTVEMQRRLAEQGLEVTPASLKELKDQSPREVQIAHNPSGAQNSQTEPEPTVRYPGENAGAASEPEITFDMPMTIQIDPETGKYIGRMKWYNAKKGYGFIVRGAGEEIFFHKSGILGDPVDFAEGQWILYDIEETRKGPEAAEVEPYQGDVTLLS